MRCKFEHDGDCCNSGATQYMCKCKQPCDTIVPMTNADRIRAMSDEELAIMFAMLRAELTRLDRSVRPYQGRDVNDNYDWLQQPAEEGDT